MRIELRVDAAGMELLKNLKEATGSKTYQDLFDNAITLLDWAITQRKVGRIVASLDERNKNYKELQMPALERTVSRPAAQVESLVQEQ